MHNINIFTIKVLIIQEMQLVNSVPTGRIVKDIMLASNKVYAYHYTRENNNSYERIHVYVTYICSYLRTFVNAAYKKKKRNSHTQLLVTYHNPTNKEINRKYHNHRHKNTRVYYADMGVVVGQVMDMHHSLSSTKKIWKVQTLHAHFFFLSL